MAEEDHDYVLVSAADARHGFGKGNYAPQPPDVRARIRKWLSPSEFSSESSDFKKHLRSYVPKTGEWLRSSELYIQWQERGETALWVNGTPGSGKSVVAATLINDFTDMKDVPVLYFFFRHANLANRTPQQLVRDWLSQLLDYSALVQCMLKSLVENHSKPEDVAFDDIWECLSSATSDLKRVYCVADAAAETIHAQGGYNKPAIPYIEAIFKDSVVVNLNLNRRQIEQDIATCVKHLLVHDMDEVSVPDEDRGLIKTTIQAKATGIFLYAKLVMEEILRGLSRRPLAELLSGLPVGVNGLYTTLLKEHSLRSGVSHNLQKLILQWVTHASRPLRLLEVAAVVRSTDQGKALGSVQEIKDTIRTACGPLLTILPDETLQVIHHSFTEFLVGDTRGGSQTTEQSYPIFTPAAIHQGMAITSIGYIISCSKDETRSEEEKTKDPYVRYDNSFVRDSLFLKYPLLQYATANWMVHVCRLDDGGPVLTQTIDQLFTIDDDTFSFWQVLWRVSEASAIRTAVLHPLHVAAHFGMTSYLKSLCERGRCSKDCHDSIDRTPLSYACERGHIEAVKLLITHGIAVNAHSTYGIATIHYACAGGYAAIVRLLLEAGADPLDITPKPKERSSRRDHELQGIQESNRHRFGMHPLHLVCKRGYTDILLELLEYVTPQQLQPGHLHWAAQAGQAKTAALLLQTGHINTDLKDEDGNTPLCLAAHCRSAATVEILLRSGADVKKIAKRIDRFQGLSTCYLRSDTDTNTTPPLHAWACEGDYSVSSLQDLVDTGRLLLKAGCDINERDEEGNTPLFHWTKFRNSEWTFAFLRLLVENGADGAATDKNGNTTLHGVTKDHSEAQNRCLVSAGGNMSTHRSSDGNTPLMCQVSGCWWGKAPPHDWYTYVEKYTVNPNAQDSSGQTLLHMILSSEYWEVSKVRHWLEAGANPNFQDAQGRNPLFCLRKTYENVDQEKDLIAVLLNAGLELNALDHTGRNCGLYATSFQDLEHLGRLQAHGVDLTARDYEGRTALHILASRDESYPDLFPFMEVLVKHGLSPHGHDYAGNTISHFAIGIDRCWESQMDNVLKLGADPSLQNNEGRSILHAAAAAPAKSQDIFTNGVGEKRLNYIISMQNRPDITLPDHRDTTALHLATTHSACLASLLLDAEV